MKDRYLSVERKNNWKIFLKIAALLAVGGAGIAVLTKYGSRSSFPKALQQQQLQQLADPPRGTYR
jgi:hypothetical protein